MVFSWYSQSRSIMLLMVVIGVFFAVGLGETSAEPGIESNLAPGTITSLTDIPVTEITPGVTARMYWGSGALVAWITLAPNAEIPREHLTSERIMMVMKGSVEQLADGQYRTMSAHEHERMTPISGRRGKRDFIYLDKGMDNALKAGTDGAEILEVYSPVRLDYLRKAGIDNLPSTISDGTGDTEPSYKPGTIHDYFDIQFSQIHPGGESRFIAGRNVLLKFQRINREIATQSTKTRLDRLVTVLRGSMSTHGFVPNGSMETDDILYLSGEDKKHGFMTGTFGCDVLEIHWQQSARDFYVAEVNKQLAAYHAIIPEGEKIELVVDAAVKGPGLCYCEGPSWINGKLYFSSMGYDDRWREDVEGSATVEMDPDGTYRYISTGIETNGTFPLDNGNFATCDMFGHRVIEMTTKGEVVRVLASEFEGKRLDGPNDLAGDNKGGIYFTDPQIVSRPHYQDGKCVFYINPDGKIMQVIKPGVVVKPNGLILSPDCKTLYVNSTPENFMTAFDINPDGTVSNPRKFGRILVTPEQLDRERDNPQTDGMTVDERGNVYVTTIMGLQIFAPSGDMVGYIHFPLMPVNCCFGDEDGKTLYVNCNDKVYKIRTKVRGAAYTLKGLRKR
ncbi:SMP-30/gluconolactonase/LRE family protein [Candidatus Latescibacterota bacterium]